jgi:cytoskeletal protein CcmA (bactofilin family)
MPNDENNLVTPQKPSDPAPEPNSETLESPEVPSTPTPTGSSPAPPPNKNKSLLYRLQHITNVYLLVFVLLIIMVLVIIFIAYRDNKSGSSNTPVGSLTDQQLAQLKGNTTLVGDAKQTLDVQSNSIFEGQVLVRSDLNVAGAIKVGGGLSLNSITVGGGGNFGQLAINGGLNVGGDTALQGNLTVQKNLSVGGSASFGSLSVSSLSVTNLSFQGNLTLTKHIVVNGSVPGRTNGTALGSGGTASVNGTDTAGTVTINTGGGPPAGCFVTVNFTQKYTNTPHVVISPSNSSAATIQYYTNRSTSSFSVCSANGPAASTTYTYDYVVYG